MKLLLLTSATLACATAGTSAAAHPPAVTADARLLIDGDDRLAGDATRRSPAGGSVRVAQRDDDGTAVQLRPWADGASYRLTTAPGRVSEIALQPGETLISVAAGDTARWVIGDTASGSASAKQVHVLVKPSAAGLRTNLIITTDRRLYRVELASTDRTAMAGIAWTYPADELLALRASQASAAAAVPVATGLTIETLDFNYAISGANVPWRPVRAFDDGRQVFIQFPKSLAQGEAPPLFVVGPGGRAELVNFRVSGLYYVVDRLFGAAELRLGEKRQQVVRIVRTGGRSRRGARP